MSNLQPVLTARDGLFFAASGQQLNAPTFMGPASTSGPWIAPSSRVLQIIISGLTTAAGATSATATVNCGFTPTCVTGDVVNYAGTYGTNGEPVVVKITPSTNSFTFAIYNAHASNALAGNITLVFSIPN